MKFLLLVALAALAASAPTSKVSPALNKALRDSNLVNIFIDFDSNTAPLAQVVSRNIGDRAQRLTAIYETSKAHAEATQASVLSFLAKSAPFAHVQSFWISNQIYVRGADAKLVEALAAFTEVSAIDKEIIITLDPVEEKDAEINAEWGVDNVGAPAVWAMGIDGSGVIVNTIDTGVRGTHNAFANRFVGAYGWYDPSGRTSAPTDGNGHGTHCTGTITGGGEIGVAPGARWTACRGCATNSCSQADLLACGQWVACPTDTSGNNPDCSRAPHLSSNSWGGGSIPYDAVINSWHAGGITPIFAMGNSGSSCSSTNAPGNHRDVIGVGAIDVNNALASFSSRGPTSDGRIKPDIAAPGVAVRSSYNSGDNAYSSLSGTSMACPHVAGVVALMKSRNPGLTYAQIKDYIYRGARTNYRPTGQNCGGVPETQVPNNAFGNGLIDAKRTIDLLAADFPQ